MAVPTASDNIFPKLILDEGGTLGTVTAGERRIGVDANGVLVWKDSAGTTSPLVALNKWDATTAPTANEDSGDGYQVGSRWIDVTNDKEYVCLDASAAAAVWTETTAAGSGSALVMQSYNRTTGNYTITGAGSDSFADVDGTNLALTMTTGAHRVLVGLMANGSVDNAAGGIFLDVMVDGVAEGGTQGLLSLSMAAASERMNLSFTWLTGVLSAGSHTFKLRWRQASTAHTATLFGNTGASALIPLQFYALEQPY